MHGCLGGTVGFFHTVFFLFFFLMAVARRPPAHTLTWRDVSTIFFKKRRGCEAARVAMCFGLWKFDIFSVLFVDWYFADFQCINAK